LITSINRWKPEKHQTLDENIITSIINRWNPDKQQTLDENIITSTPWKARKRQNFWRWMVMGGKSLVYNELCIFVSLFSWQVKSINVWYCDFWFH
jgi:hypothetical protein